MSFNGVDDCDAIGRRLAQLARRPGRHTVVIVGGGLEGIEALGEILRRFRHSDKFAVSVVEAGARLLPGASRALDAAVRAHCAGHEVRILTRSRVTSVTPRQVRLDTGETLRSDLTMWTGGSAPSPLLQACGLADGPRDWAPVKASLQSRLFSECIRRGRCRGVAAPARQAGLLRDADGRVRGGQRRPRACGPQAPQFQPVAQADAGRLRRPRHFPGFRRDRGGVPGARGGQGSRLPGARTRSTTRRSALRRCAGAPPGWCAQRKNWCCPG